MTLPLVACRHARFKSIFCFLQFCSPCGCPAPMQANNPALTISYCLPVLPSGLTADGVALLASAVAQGVRVDEVAVMTMVSV